MQPGQPMTNLPGDSATSSDLAAPEAIVGQAQVQTVQPGIVPKPANQQQPETQITTAMQPGQPMMQNGQMMMQPGQPMMMMPNGQMMMMPNGQPMKMPPNQQQPETQITTAMQPVQLGQPMMQPGQPMMMMPNGQPMMMMPNGQPMMMPPNQVQPGVVPKPAHVPPAATGPTTEKWHGPKTQKTNLFFFLAGCFTFGGCWLCCCLVAAGPGLDERQVWTGPQGEKYVYPTGELVRKKARLG